MISSKCHAGNDFSIRMCVFVIFVCCMRHAGAINALVIQLCICLFDVDCILFSWDVGIADSGQKEVLEEHIFRLAENSTVQRLCTDVLTFDRKYV